MKNYKLKLIVTVTIALLIIVVATATAFAATSEFDAEVTNNVEDGRNVSILQQQKEYGEMKQIDFNSDTGAKKYKDNKYAYWFDGNDCLISRVLIDVSNQTEKKSITRDAALELARKEIALYVDNFEINEQIEVDIKNNKESNTPWEICFVMRNEDDVICNSYDVIFDIYGDVCLMFMSEQQPAKEKMSIDKTSAYNIALNAISKDMSTTYGKDLTAEDILKEYNIEITEQELFAYEGNSIWSLAISNFKHDDENLANYTYTYFIQVDAVSGEILYLGICRNGVPMN